MLFSGDMLSPLTKKKDKSKFIIKIPARCPLAELTSRRRQERESSQSTKVTGLRQHL
ncbi:unnamed protein product [Gulo gulo]|uniref:Uncharacterized protein n=1 Tax=Gulo gulo TaxID=48420 RepID=A0A9X9LX98_GULGU|nr:unnamed protein product [Gulo gulo]